MTSQGGERRSRGPPRHLPREMTVLDDEEAQHHVTCNSSCKSCLTTVTTFRWVLVRIMFCIESAAKYILFIEIFCLL